MLSEGEKSLRGKGGGGCGGYRQSVPKVHFKLDSFKRREKAKANSAVEMSAIVAVYIDSHQITKFFSGILGGGGVLLKCPFVTVFKYKTVHRCLKYTSRNPPRGVRLKFPGHVIRTRWFRSAFADTSPQPPLLS